jgi:hypothetical protein
MRKLILLFIALLMAPLAANGVQAQSAADTLASYGMLGTWANDCSQPASSTNFYAVYKRSSGGQVTRVYYNDPDKVYNTYIIVDAIRVSDDQVAYRQKGSDGTVEIVIQVDGKRYHVLSSRVVNGKVFVKDGKFANGDVSPWQTKCEK